MSDGRIQADLKPDEVKVIQIMRETTEPDAEFIVYRRQGKIVNVKRTTLHVNEFTNHALATQ